MKTIAIARRLVAALLLAGSFGAGAAFTDLTGVTASASGENHTCAIAGGTAYCWGANAMGQLGNGTLADSPSPTPVAGLPSPVTAISAGLQHTCAVAGSPQGEVYCWGSNETLQLGPTSTLNFCGPAANIPCSATAQKSSTATTLGATAVAVGWNHTCAVVSGAVKCWGLQLNGRLGDGATSFTNKAASAATVVGNTTGATVVVAGTNWSCARVGTVVRCWGGNGSGSLGDGTGIDSATAVQVSGITTAVGLAGGDSHACAVLSSGAMSCWGSNSSGQLGNNSTASSLIPVAVTGISSGVSGAAPAQIAAGASHTCAVLGGPTNGSLKCWGRNDFQQSDFGSSPQVPVPPAVPRIAPGVASVSVGSTHTCAVVGGALRCFGRNVNGQLGTGFTAIASSALAATPLTDGATRVSSGSLHACAVRNGAVACWGFNGQGQLGNGSFVHSPTPVAVAGITSGATAVATGASHSCAIVNGRVKCWGSNSAGQLGNGTTNASLTPVDVVTAAGPPALLLQNVTAIAAGSGHTCAVVDDGFSPKAWCWGSNFSGQLGDNTTTSRTVATPTTGASTAGAIAIAAGNSHTCAVVAGNALKCWGSNSAGQLGTSTVGNTLQAAFAGGLLLGVTGVAAGNGHTCAVQNGALRCFGNNSSGQLGDNTLVTPVPLGAVRAPVASGATAVAGGFAHTCAIVNGGLRCWGDGTKGQLGNGSTTSLRVPTDVPGLFSDVSGVSAGSSHTCAIYGGGVTCFGFGEYGELGSPRYAFLPAPTPVKIGFGSATTLLSNRNPSESGQAVTLSATVAFNASIPVPGGTVSFKDGAVAIAGCGAVALTGTGTVRRATCTTSAIAGGTRSLTAEYAGDANFAASASPALTQVVQVTVPTGLGFPHLTNVALGSVVTSAAATIAGITVPVPITVTGGLYSIGCTGTFTTAPGTVSAGATVCVRHVTPLALGATTTTTLTVGTGNATFNSTTTLSSPNTMPATLSAGTSHTLVVTPNGQVWGWGDNAAGKLGNGNTTVSAVPVRAGTLTDVIAVAAGMGHSLALRSDGTVWAWGLDSDGQLGNGGTSPSTCTITAPFNATFACSRVPLPVQGLDNVVAISVGWRHSMALRRDGTVWAWGANNESQLGGLGNANVPRAVATGGVAKRIAAGYMHSVALMADGTVKAWGKGNMGELGPGATVGTPDPTTVTGFTRPVTDIAAGGAYTLARLDNNALVAWGSNRYGQLGDQTVPFTTGGASFRAAPAPVPNLINVVEFSAGVSHAFAVTSSGDTWGWGLNARAQTGIATSVASCGFQGNLPCIVVPQRALSHLGATRVAAGGAHTVTVRPDKSIVAFGDNGVGQLGNTTGNYGQAIAPPGNPARFDQNRYEPDRYLIPEGTFGTPAGVGQGSLTGVLNVDTLSAGLVFADQGVGSASTPLPVRLSNVAAANAIGITSISAAGSANAGEFTVASNDCPATLAAGASCTLQVVFAPAAFGARTGTLTIVSNALESNTLTYTLTGDGVDGRAPSTLTLGSSASTSAAGLPVAFTASVVTAGASTAGTVTFRDNGVALAGCTAVPVSGALATCTTSALAVGVHPIAAEYSGNASVQPSASAAIFQTVITVTTPAAIPRLGNISTRMQVLTGNDVMIGGFIIGGSQAKTVVVRARGPSLAPFGIANFLPNPKLDLFSGATIVESNDDWVAAANAAAIQASGFAPAVAQESAILRTLAPGAYTAVVSGVGNTTGVGIVEVFEVDLPEVPLVNISTRGQVLTGNDVMIGGFIIQGDSPQTVIIRARGPSLVPFGITNALANPVLQLFAGATQIAINDNWQAAANAAEIQARGFAPANPFESAILVTLNPGAYTAIVTGANGGIGVGIVEVFAQ